MINLMNEFEIAVADPWAYAYAYIKSNEMTNKEIHRGTGIPESTIRAWFNGGRGQPAGKNLKKLMRFILDHKKRKENNDESQI
jgi:predicted transcriptional regulator